MFNLGFGEIALILVVALLFVGPKMLPEIATTLGKWIREFRKATSDIRQEIELDDIIRKPLQELRDAATLPPEELKRRDELRASQRRTEEEERIRKEREANAAKALAETPPAASVSVDPYSAVPSEPVQGGAPLESAAAPAIANQTVFDPDLATAVKAEMKKSPALPSPYAAERTIVDDVLSQAAKSDERARAAGSRIPASTVAVEKNAFTPVHIPSSPIPPSSVARPEVVSVSGTMILNPPPPSVDPERTPVVELSSFEMVDPPPAPSPSLPRVPPPPPVKKS